VRLAGRACLVRLTSLGIRVLRDVVPTTEGGAFEASVEDEDHQGVWVTLRGEDAVRGRVLLVKWAYVATIEIMNEASSS